MSALTAERLEREKQAVISKLLEKDRQLSEISSRYWREIDRDIKSFDSREQLADAVRGVSKAALLETFRKSVLERDQSLQVVTGGDGLEASRALGRLTELPPVPAS